jgi:hypothetical protein
MSDQDFYIKVEPGSIISAEGNMDLQRRIKADIRDQISSAIENLESVPKSGDAERFGGKTPDEYAEEILQRVLHELPKRTGYMVLFKELKVGEESVIEHKLGACPLTDVYQLDYFPVVCSEDGLMTETLTTFYLYHSDESKLRFRPEEAPQAPSISIPIDPPDGHAFRRPLKTLLEEYKVEYTDGSSFADLIVSFWKAFFSAPNDKFDDNQYCHSPWFDRCCREERTVKEIKSRREWDDIYLQVRPRKTINYPTVLPTGGLLPEPVRAPNNIQVAHFDFDTLGLKLLTNAELPVAQTDAGPSSTAPGWPAPDSVSSDHIKVMVLLKV